jgi:hypothetical protein
MNVRRTAYVSRRGRDWMLTCHPDPAARAEVISDLILRMQMAAALGPIYGADRGQPIRKLEGFENLWESRVRHASGWYRQFFRFTSIAGERAVVFVDGTKKASRRLPQHVLDAAARRLDLYVEALTADLALRNDDLARTN